MDVDVNKMQTVALIWIVLIVLLNPVCFACNIEHLNSSQISYERKDTYERVSQCWTIPVPEHTYISIELSNLKFNKDCDKASLKIFEAVTSEMRIYCGRNYNDPINFKALNNVTVSYFHGGDRDWYTRSSFALKYTKESIICTRSDNFRCSPYQCIPKYQVCDRKNDCDNAVDELNCEMGIVSADGANTTKNIAIKWLMERSIAYGWEENTHRAITALYLAQMENVFSINKSEKQLVKELEVRQLEVKTLVALLRNSSEPISVSELSMYVNALLVTCHNVRQFYGYNLIKVLYERASVTKTPCPAAYLTLCNAGWTLSSSDVTYLVDLLMKNPDVLFFTDIQAMAIMALSCVKNKFEEFDHLFNGSSIYNETIQKFIESQHPDGSFGNIYTTALVTQALVASGQEKNQQWNVTSTVQFFKRYFNSEELDFLAVYLALPVFNSKSLVDVRHEKCSDSYRKQVSSIEGDITDVKERLDDKMLVQYSLFIGDKGDDIIHTIYLKIPKNSSAYDLMRVAQATDPKYKFLHRYTSGRMYVYQIANITNDPEAGKFWLLYTMDIKNKSDINEPSYHTMSPDKLTLKDGEHLVMWYKTVLI